MCKALEELEEQGRQKGRLEGRLEGRSQGEYAVFLKQIRKKIIKNKSFEQIVDELEQKIDVVQPLYDFVKDHTEISEDELIELYLSNIGA